MITDSKATLVTLLGAAILICAFASIVYPSYFVLDDATNIYEAQIGEPGNLTLALAMGRPIQVVFFEYTYGLFPSFDGLKVIRLITLIIVCLCFVACHALLTPYFAQPGRFVISVSTCLLPPFAIAIFFPAAGCYPIAYLCGLSSALALQSTAVELPGQRASQHVLTFVKDPMTLLAFLLLLIGFFTYPPAAQVVLCLPCLYICRFRPSDTLRNTLAACLKTLAVFCVTAAAFFFIWQGYKALFLSGIDLGQRTMITSVAQLLGKLEWFLVSVLPEAGSLFKLVPSPALAALVYTTIALHFSFLPVSATERVLRLLLWLALLPVAYLANIMAQESWSEYRTMFALHTYIWFAFAGAIWSFSERALGHFRSREARGVRDLCALGALAILVLRQSFAAGPTLTQPHADELLVVRDAVRDFERERARYSRVVILRPTWDAQHPALARYDLIGVPGSLQPWAAPPLIKSVYLDLYRRPIGVPVVSIPITEQAKFDTLPGDYVIDLDTKLREYARLRATPLPRYFPP